MHVGSLVSALRPTSPPSLAFSPQLLLAQMSSHSRSARGPSAQESESRTTDSRHTPPLPPCWKIDTSVARINRFGFVLGELWGKRVKTVQKREGLHCMQAWTCREWAIASVAGTSPCLVTLSLAYNSPFCLLQEDWIFWNVIYKLYFLRGALCLDIELHSKMQRCSQEMSSNRVKKC